MKRSGLRAVTAFSALALVVGVIQPASASAISSNHIAKPTAPTIVSVTETAPTSKGTSAKKFANIVVTVTPAPNVTRTLVTIKGGRSCKIVAPALSCTIPKIKIGKTLKITAKSKFANSGYGAKSTRYTYTVLGIATATP